jgi:hypothetical protein
MRSDGLLRHFALAFVLALAGYAVFYFAIENRRTRQGPWQVAFTNNPAGAPTIIIDQPTIGVTNVQITFPGATFGSTNAPCTLRFDQPRQVPYPVPLGKCLFMDTTFLPGTITFELVGHEIELLPRVLIIDFQEHPWQSGALITLPPAKASRPSPANSPLAPQ